VTQLLDPTFVIVALVALAWLTVSVIVVAACATSARADAEMTAEDDAVAMCGAMGWLISQAPPAKDMGNRPKEDLQIPPERPVRHVEIIHRTHLT
jgi:hypothetical protein